jgi:transcriptional accessory protein Tex/SPT6
LTSTSSALAVQTNITHQLAAELKVRPAQVAVALLDSGATVPLIARYRKQATAGLDIVRARVLEVDLARARIALTMKLDAKPAPSAGGDSYPPAARGERAPRGQQHPAPGAMAAAFAKQRSEDR